MSETFVEIGNCKLYHGDSIKILSELGQCADLIVSDPPYRLTAGGCTEGGLHERFGGGGMYGNTGEIVPCDIEWSDFMPLLYAALGPSTQAYVMCNNRHLVNLGNAAEAAGFGFHNWLVWDKGTATPNRWYMKNCEFTGFFYKTPARAINDCGAKQLISCPQIDVSGQFAEDGNSHATEKPVALMQHYIEQSSDVGDLILDPFMGSCSTGVACIRAGRKFIGIEKNERFFNMSVKRIQAENKNLQQQLF